MINKYKIHITKSAKEDIKGIIIYIKSQFSANLTADKMLDAFDNAILGLVDFPYKYPSIRDERLASLGFRMLTVKNYIVFYSIDESSSIVNIERVLYGRRDWKHIL